MGKLNNTTTEVQQAMNEQLDGDQVQIVGWDDIQGNVGGGALHPSLSPTWADYDYGVAGGVAFRTLGFSVGNIIYGTLQTPHAMKLLSDLHMHLHFTTPTDPTGKKFQFQMDVVACGVNGTYSVPTGSPFTAECDMTSDLSDTQSILELGIIPAVNTTVSTLYKIKLTRIAASADEYLAGDIYVDYTDAHYQIDQERGSRSEYVK